MLLSERQTAALKLVNTRICIKTENPKNLGAKRTRVSMITNLLVPLGLPTKPEQTGKTCQAIVRMFQLCL